MNLGCRAQLRMHPITNSTSLDLKRQVNLPKNYLQVTINPYSEVELLFKFECVLEL